MATLEVLDVGHGVCVALETDDGQLWLFDCGHGDDAQPSIRFAGRAINKLFVSNYDHDHISDLPGLAGNVRTLVRNPSISAQQLRALKAESGPIGHAMAVLLSMIGSTHTMPVAPGAGTSPGVRTTLFYNDFSWGSSPEHGVFRDTNNISLVTFLEVNGLRIVLPGDLERPGWRALLQRPDFRAELARVNVFMASHHGRESGFCEEVFDYCKPQLVVISDSEKVHETQEMTNTYASKASGIELNGVKRWVLTTRKDGAVRFTTTPYATTVDTNATMLQRLAMYYGNGTSMRL